MENIKSTYQLLFDYLNQSPFIHFVVLDGAKRKSAEGGGENGGFSKMAKKVKGRGALTAAGTLVTKLSSKEKVGPKPEKKGLATTVSTVSMLKKKFVEDDFDDDFDDIDPL